MIEVRPAHIGDSNNLSSFIRELDSENKYLLYDPGERKNDASVISSFISRISNDRKSMIVIAQNEDKKIVGFVCGEGSRLNRQAHVLTVNIGVLKKYQGLGIGKMLGNALLNHASKSGISRAEATVIKDNTISLNLCKKFGFEVEGIKKNSIKIGNEFHDEYLLSLFI